MEELKNMKKKLSIIFFLLTMLLLSLNIYAEMNVTVAQNADAKTLDPTASNDVPSHRVTLQIYAEFSVQCLAETA